MGLTEYNLAELREFYENKPFTKANVDKGPMALFSEWLGDAIEHTLLEPNAMILATSTPQGLPSARTVLLKDLNDQGLVFYTNYESRKGRELDENPNAALVFLWLPLARQVRLEGVVRKYDAEATRTYFQSRPRGSQIGAWSSPQSQPVPNREWLDERQAEMEEKFKLAEKLPVPPFWGGYVLEPTVIEFWQGRPNRLHDRLVFNKVDGNWSLSRLAP